MYHTTTRLINQSASRISCDLDLVAAPSVQWQLRATLVRSPGSGRAIRLNQRAIHVIHIGVKA